MTGKNTKGSSHPPNRELTLTGAEGWFSGVEMTPKPENDQTNPNGRD